MKASGSTPLKRSTSYMASTKVAFKPALTQITAGLVLPLERLKSFARQKQRR